MNWRSQEQLFEESYHLAPSQGRGCAEARPEQGQREGSGLTETLFLFLCPLEGR